MRTLQMIFFKRIFCSVFQATFFAVLHPSSSSFGIFSRWWFQAFFLFSPLPGEMISDWLNPPTRFYLVVVV